MVASAALALAMISLAATGCARRSDPAREIAERCEMDGEAKSVCACLSTESARLLDPDLLNLVALAAKGRSEEADAQARDLPPARADKFEATLSRIEDACRSKTKAG